MFCSSPLFEPWMLKVQELQEETLASRGWKEHQGLMLRRDVATGVALMGTSIIGGTAKRMRTSGGAHELL